jgi:hypothetical protein
MNGPKYLFNVHTRLLSEVWCLCHVYEPVFPQLDE